MHIDELSFRIGKQKRIALVAHDGKKDDMVDWVDTNKDILKNHFLCGTGTTARILSEIGRASCRERV